MNRRKICRLRRVVSAISERIVVKSESTNFLKIRTGSGIREGKKQERSEAENRKTGKSENDKKTEKENENG